jgi:hypothetical protein
VRVSPPKPAPVVKKVTQPVTNVVNKTVPKVNDTVNKTVPKTTNTVTKTTETVKRTTDSVSRTTGSVTRKVTGTVSGTGSTGGGSGSSGSGGGGSRGGPAGPAGPLDRILGSVTGVVTGTSGTARNTVGAVSGITGTAGSGSPGSLTLVRSADGTTFLVAPGGSGPGSNGPGGTGMLGGTGSAGLFGGGGGGSLAAMLAGATPMQLRAVLSHLEGCMPQLPAIDRRVISMRAGLNGAPLTRPQVGQRLGMSRQQVRNTERRALNRLQYAAANTGCAGTLVGPFAVAGIGSLLPQLQFAGPVPVNGGSLTLTGGAGGPFEQARGLVSRSAEPLLRLGEGGGSGPAWAIILFTVLLSVSIAALTRELRHTF